MRACLVEQARGMHRWFCMFPTSISQTPLVVPKYTCARSLKGSPIGRFEARSQRLRIEQQTIAMKEFRFFATRFHRRKTSPMPMGVLTPLPSRASGEFYKS